MNDYIIHSCNNANCTVPTTTGKCLQACWDRYNRENGITSDIAYWDHRAQHNDYLWVECSNCKFRVENYVAVILDKSDTKFSGVKYNFCPICGKRMRVRK